MICKKILTLVVLAALLGIFNCTGDPPEATGTFNVVFSGNINDEFQGNAFFELVPNNTIGVIYITLAESETVYFRLTFYNPDPAQIFLEPGSYTVVGQLGQNVPGEVLVEYINEQGTFSAASGEVRVGIVKNNQIKGEVVNALFNLLNTSCNGNFDAIPD